MLKKLITTFLKENQWVLGVKVPGVKKVPAHLIYFLKNIFIIFSSNNFLFLG
jgi:hypothetical protein